MIRIESKLKVNLCDLHDVQEMYGFVFFFYTDLRTFYSTFFPVSFFNFDEEDYKKNLTGFARTCNTKTHTHHGRTLRPF